MKYIDADRLRARIENLKIKACGSKATESDITAALASLDLVIRLIDSLQQEQLPGIEEHGIPGKDFIPVEWVDACEKYGKWKIVQQEQPEDIVVIAKTFLDTLSKTPYNNKPITDAQIIVKQLLLFFENPKEYNPDAILEQPNADLDADIEMEWDSFNKHLNESGEKSEDVIWLNWNSFADVARNFYGLRNRALEEAARHVYESWMGGTMDNVRRDMVELGRIINAIKEEEEC